MSIKTNWNLKELYRSDLAWSKDLTKAEKLYSKLKKADIKTDNTIKILKLLSLEDLLKKKIALLHIYASLKMELNIKSANAKENLNKVKKLESLVDLELSFLHTAINSLPKSKIKYILGLKKSKPITALLNSILNESKSCFNNKEKKLIELYSRQLDTYEDIHRQIQINTINFNRISTQGKMLKLNNSNIQKFCQNPNREIRKKAYVQRQKTYEKNKEAIATVLKCHINAQVLQSKVDQAENPIDYMLSAENFNQEFFKVIIKENLRHKNVVKNFYDNYKKQLKIRNLYYYDLNAEEKKKSNKKFSIEESKAILESVTEQFSSETKNILEKTFSESWIQIVPSHVKDSFSLGFSYNPIITHPFLLSTFDGSSSDVLTLAHEVGHVIHGETVNKNNSFYNPLYLSSTQELFAFTLELLTAYKIKDSCTTEIMKKEFLNTLSKYFIVNTFDRSQLVDFEIQLYDMVENDHKFTAAILNQKHKFLNKKYYKSIVNLRGKTGVDWAFSDRYFNNFYSAEYLVAFCLAAYCAEKIYHNDIEFIKRYEQAMKQSDGAYLDKICKILEPDIEIFNPKFLVSFAYNKLQELIKENY